MAGAGMAMINAIGSSLVSVFALGAAPLLGRRLQEDCLFDTDDERLRRQRSTLRVRCEGGKSLLTYKGPVQPGLMKLREELETVVADGDTLLAILHELGLRVWFRYEKYREEFAAEDVIIAVDEPIDATGCAGKENCMGEDAGRCMTHDLWASLNAKMIEYLDSISLKKLVDEQLAKGVSIQDAPVKRAISSQPVVRPIKITAPNSVFALGSAMSK